MKHPMLAVVATASILVAIESTAGPGVSVPAPETGAAACALVHPCGDVNASGTVTSTDALNVLKLAVGQPVSTSCEVSGSGGSLLNSGQDKCYSQVGVEVDCAGTGQDGETQSGVALDYTDNGNGTITDDSTGLVWEKLDDSNLDGDAGIHDKDRTYTFAAANEKVATFNTFSFGGRNDWRIPNVRELASILNYGKYSPAVSGVFHSSCTSGCKTTTCSCTGTMTPYWSSTPYANLKAYSWMVSFVDGQMVVTPRTTALYVRLVAGGL